ncbi:MAG: hypothetical protein AB1505_36610 [Candidatus Latescibacterota bacterium]
MPSPVLPCGWRRWAPGTRSPLAPRLRQGVAAAAEAEAAYEAAIRAEKAAEADEEIAQASLRRQYELNYLAARQRLGRARAERLFPARQQSARGAAQPAESPVQA